MGTTFPLVIVHLRPIPVGLEGNFTLYKKEFKYMKIDLNKIPGILIIPFLFPIIFFLWLISFCLFLFLGSEKAGEFSTWWLNKIKFDD